MKEWRLWVQLLSAEAWTQCVLWCIGGAREGYGRQRGDVPHIEPGDRSGGWVLNIKMGGVGQHQITDAQGFAKDVGELFVRLDMDRGWGEEGGDAVPEIVCLARHAVRL